MATRSPKPSDVPAFGEHERVRLRSLVGTDAGALMPGAVGTIVYRHVDGWTYEVEFAGSVDQVVTLHAGDLSPAG